MGYGAAIAVVLLLIMMVYIATILYRLYQDEKGVSHVSYANRKNQAINPAPL